MGERSYHHLSDIHDALVTVDPQLADNPRLRDTVVLARTRGFAEENIPVWRSTVLFEDHIGVVFDALGKMTNGDEQTPLFDALTLWKAEEVVYDIPHDFEAFKRRQSLLKEFYPSTEEGSESA